MPSDDGLIHGFAEVDGMTGACPTAVAADPAISPALVSAQARAGGAALGPLELWVRLMGPEIISNPPQWLGGCTYRVGFVIGTPGRYHAQVVLWRSAFESLRENDTSWLHWQQDFPFGRAVWLDASIDAGTNATSLSLGRADGAPPLVGIGDAGPLHRWDRLVGARLPPCGCSSLGGNGGDPCCHAPPGRWLLSSPPWRGGGAGIGTDLPWSGAVLEGYDWRPYHCQPRGWDGAWVRRLLRGRVLAVVGCSQARMVFHALMSEFAGLGPSDVHHESKAFGMEDRGFGPGSRWVYHKNTFGDLPLNSTVAGLPYDADWHADVIIRVIGNWPLACVAWGGHWDLGRWYVAAQAQARELLEYSRRFGTTVLWMGNPFFPFRRDMWVTTMYPDSRTYARLRSVDALAAQALRSQLDEVEAADPGAAALLRERVVHLDATMPATMPIADASEDIAHYTQAPMWHYHAGVVAGALRVSVLNRPPV